MRLYHHKTDGGAEYLFDTYIQTDYCNSDTCRSETPNDGNGNCAVCGSEKHREGVINDNTKYVVRLDGDITKDAELTIKNNLYKINEMLEQAKRDLYNDHAELMRADGHIVTDTESAYQVADGLDYDQYMNMAFHVGYIRALTDVLK